MKRWYEPPDEGAVGCILFIIGRGGGGHHASAMAVKECLSQRGLIHAEQVELIDCEWLMASALFGRSASPGSFSVDELYNLLVRLGAYHCASLFTCLCVLVQFLLSPFEMPGLRAFWAARKPLMVVSFVPHFNDLFHLTLAEQSPLVTIVTDMSSTFAHRWIDKYREQSGAHYLVAGTPSLQAQARDYGWEEPWLVCTSGMVVHPAYYTHQRPASTEQSAASSTMMKGLIFFGGFAPARTLEIVKRALSSQRALELTVICGKNDWLRKHLGRFDNRVRALGFIPPWQVPRTPHPERWGSCVVLMMCWPVAQVSAEMRSAAFVLGKPGPGVLAEACLSGIPFVVERRHTMSHERGSLQWIEEAGVGIVVNDLEHLPVNLAARIAPCREAVARLDNHAVFQVAELLEILAADHQNNALQTSQLEPPKQFSEAAPLLPTCTCMGADKYV